MTASTLSIDINNPDKPDANPDPHPLTPVEVPVNAVICPTCRLPITDGPFKLDTVGIRYHEACEIPAVTPSKGDDARTGRKSVSATQLPYLATTEAYDKRQKEIDDQLKANEEAQRERLEKTQKDQQAEIEKHRDGHKAQGNHEPAKHGHEAAVPAKVVTPSHTPHR